MSPDGSFDGPTAAGDERYDVVVVGAGVTGLACAWALHQAGGRALVLEAGPRVGGCVETIHRDDGFVFESGPHTLRSAGDGLLEHLEAIGLTEDIVEPRGSGSRYILRKGRLARLPRSPAGLLTSSFLGPGSKLRLLAEPWIRPSAEDDPSLGAFIGRRLGPAVRHGLLDAFVGGIWAGDPDRISARAAFPDLVQGVEEHGSLLRYMLTRRKSAKTEPRAPSRRRGIFTLRRGLASWPETLAAGLPQASVRTGSPVGSLERRGEEWSVALDGAEGATVRGRHVVLTGGPAPTAHLAGPWLDTQVRQGLSEMRASSLAVVHLGYDRSAVAEPPDGFGVLIPHGENRSCLGILFVSSLFPSRAPEGCLTTTTFFGGIRNEGRLASDDDALIDLAHREHAQLLGFRQPPRVAHVRRWPRALPQYELGHHRLANALGDQEERLPSLHLAGRFRGGVSVPDCWRRGTELGLRLAGDCVRRRHDPTLSSPADHPRDPNEPVMTTKADT